MADQLQLRGGTTTEHSTFTGALREVTVDTDKDTLIVHDAATAGGHPLLREDGSNSALSLGTAGTPSIKFTGDTNTGIYSPGADQVAISTGGTGRLFVNASGRVGIGTSSPAQPIDIVTSGSDAYMRHSNGTVTGFVGVNNNNSAFDIYTFTNHPTRFFTNNTERARIDSSGRLLVGTSSARGNINSGAKTLQIETAVNNVSTGLSVVNNSSTGWTSRIALGMTGGTAVGSNTIVSSGNSLGALSWVGADGTNLIEAGRIQTQVDGTPGTNDMPGRLVFSTTADGAASPTERMRIDSSGRVGVGTTSPSATLDVNGDCAVANTKAYQVKDSGGTGRYAMYMSGSLSPSAGNDLFIGNTLANSLVLYTNNTERLRIDSSGRVGVGTSSPAYTLVAKGGVATTGIVTSIINPVSGGNSKIHFTDDATYNWTAGTVGNAFAITPAEASTSAGTPALYIDSSRRVGVGTTSPVALLTVGSTSTSSTNTTIASSTTGDGGIYFHDGANSGAITYAHSSNDLYFRTNGSEKVRIDSSGRVGIGTSSPSEQLHVKDGRILCDAAYPQIQLKRGSASAQSDIKFFTGSTAKWSIGQALAVTNESFEIYDYGASKTRLLINTSGNVGIGTTIGTRPLVISKGEAEGIEFGPGESSDVNLTLHFNRDTSVYTTNEIRAAAHTFYIGSSEKARIDSSGRLLVGTSTSRSVDNEKILQIEGVDQPSSSMSLTRNTNSGAPPNITFGKSRGTATGSNTIVQSGDSLGFIGFAGADGADLNTLAASIVGAVDGTPGSNDMPGRLVFSTTTDGDSSPTERMRIKQNGQLSTFDSGGYGHVIESSRGASTSDYLIFGRYSATNIVGSGGTQSFGVYTNGNVVNTNNSYGSLSDIKLKENIVDASSQWNDLKAIQVRNYNFKEGQTHTQIGVVAQEIELVSPGLVTESPDRDEEGNDLGTTTKSVNYSVLYMKAVKALQEAMERIETLEAKVSALEAN